MLILLGILGLLQSTLLPALIIRKAGRLRGGMTEQLLLRTPVRTAAKAALGLWYLALIAQKIADIFR